MTARLIRALTVEPLQADSAALEQVPETPRGENGVRVRTLAVGVCGTDREILHGDYGLAPPGARRLILGHESLGEVVEAPPGCDVATGDHVVAMVRHPDPVPCGNCAIGEWDMCRNGRYTEHGIKAIDGFATDSFVVAPERLVKVDASLGLAAVLLEPTSVVAKAWEHIDRIGARARFQPRRALVTGAGPIGLLAALLGRQRGLEVRVLDRATDGPKPALVRALGASYFATTIEEAGEGADIVVECTGATTLVAGAMTMVAPDGIVCLTGVSSGGRPISLDLGALNRELVLENNVVFGSVNANRRHYDEAAKALAGADRSWLTGVLTRSVPIDRWGEAIASQPGDVKTYLRF